MPRIARTLGLASEDFQAVLEWTLALRQRLELPHTLSGILDESLIPRLVPMAAADPSLTTNPKPCSDSDLSRVFHKALEGDLSP